MIFANATSTDNNNNNNNKSNNSVHLLGMYCVLGSVFRINFILQNKPRSTQSRWGKSKDGYFPSRALDPEFDFAVIFFCFRSCHVGLTSSLTSGLWIGLNSLSFNSGWQWSSDSPFRYLNWLPGRVKLLSGWIHLHMIYLETPGTFITSRVDPKEKSWETSSNAILVYWERVQWTVSDVCLCVRKERDLFIYQFFCGKYWCGAFHMVGLLF